MNWSNVLYTCGHCRSLTKIWQIEGGVCEKSLLQEELIIHSFVQ